MNTETELIGNLIGYGMILFSIIFTAIILWNFKKNKDKIVKGEQNNG